jgi:hypothetical protein
MWPWPILAFLFSPFGFIAPKYFKLFGFYHTRWRLFQKRIIRTQFYIYGF